MINLIRNEFTKLFSKKTIYVIAIIFLTLMIIGVLINKAINNLDEAKVASQFSGLEKTAIEEDNFKDESDLDQWANARTFEIESELLAKYDKDTLMGYIVRNDLNEENEIIHKMATIEAKAKKAEIVDGKNFKEALGNSKEYQKLKKEFDSIIKKYESFSQEDYKKYRKERAESGASNFSIINDKIQIGESEALTLPTDNILEIEKEMLALREKHDIEYKVDYLNEALEEYKYAASALKMIEKPTKDFSEMDEDEKNAYNQYHSFNEQKLKSKYIIENKVDLDSVNSAKNSIKNIIKNYGTIYIIMIIMIAASIVAEEYNKGTIKTLLLKPYRRWKILLAKLIAVIGYAVIVFAIMAVLQTIVASIAYGPKTLLEPVVTYNFDTESIQETSIIPSLIGSWLLLLPSMLVYVFLAFAGSVVFASTAAAIIVPVVGMVSEATFNSILLFMSNEKTWVKFVPTLNWHWEYIFGLQANTKSLIPAYSIGITIAVYAVLLMVAFIVFGRRDITNQ